VMSGYDADTDTLPCQNCGGQYMYGRPSGIVNTDTVACLVFMCMKVATLVDV